MLIMQTFYSEFSGVLPRPLAATALREAWPLFLDAKHEADADTGVERALDDSTE